MTDELRKANKHERVAFATGGSVHVEAADVPEFIVLGVSRDAYKFMSSGRTHTFDLRYLGLPSQLIMFGGKSYGHVLDALALMAPGRLISDLKTEHPVKEDESMIVKMRKGARAWSAGMLGNPLEGYTDADLDDLFAAILRQDITPGDLRGV